MNINFNDTLPLYLQIKNILKNKIESEQYKEGEVLPTELELESMFNVSRITIRQAMSELVNEGYIYRVRGKGTIVKYNKINENLSNLISFTNEMKMKGLEPYTKSVDISIVKADKNIAKNLNVKIDDFLYRIERVRGANNMPFVMFISYFSLHRNLPLDKELYYGSLYSVLEKSCGAVASSAIDYFEAICANEELSEKLDVDICFPLLKRLRQSFDVNGDVFEYTICYYRADRFRCSVSY